jgi:parvulin-like peptidyl-prolyl isomerase
MATDAGLQGFGSAEEYLAANVGAGATVADYQSYMTTYYNGFMFFQSEYENMVPTQEEMDAYFAEHEEEYASQGVTKDGIYVDVRHILVLPEGATVATIYSETFPEEAWAVAEKEADEILNQWLSGDQTEDAFAALANEFSADTGSNTTGGLYTDVYVGMMVEEFEAWCFDETRQVGDYGIVKTALGYHIMYFSGSRPIWVSYVESDLMGDRGMALINETTEKYPLTVSYEKISLGYVNMMG